MAFLAAAAVLVVVSLCLNGASERSGSWARLEEGDGSDTRTFTYRIGKEYQSYLLYAEVYDHETLLGRTILDCWPLGEDWPDGQQPDPGPDGTVTEARSRRGTATLLSLIHILSYQETTFTKVSVRAMPAFLSKMEVR